MNPIVIGFLAILVIAVLVYFFAFKQKATNTSQNSLSEDEVTLLRRCFNDAAQMERMIAFEQRRSPSETRAQAVRSAIQSLKKN